MYGNVLVTVHDLGIVFELLRCGHMCTEIFDQIATEPVYLINLAHSDNLFGDRELYRVYKPVATIRQASVSIIWLRGLNKKTKNMKSVGLIVAVLCIQVSLISFWLNN